MDDRPVDGGRGREVTSSGGTETIVLLSSAVPFSSDCACTVASTVVDAERDDTVTFISHSA